MRLTIFGSALITLVFISATFTQSVAADQKPSRAHEISDTEAIGIQQKFFDAMIKQDAKAMETLSADDMAYVHLNGMKQSKPEFLAWVSKMQFRKFDLQEHQVHAIGERAFVLDGVVENTRGMHLRLATAWEQRPQGWQMILLQYTEIPEPKK